MKSSSLENWHLKKRALYHHKKNLWLQKPLSWVHTVSDRQQVDTFRAADDSVIHAPVKGGILEELLNCI